MAQNNPQPKIIQDAIKQAVPNIHASLQRLVGFHRQLLDLVRVEREALLNANMPAIQEATSTKQGLIESIKNEEITRQKLVAELAFQCRRPYAELTLLEIAIMVQANDQKAAEQLRSAFNALTILIKRVTDANSDNAKLVENSLSHVSEMTRNVLGDTGEKNNTYGPRGTAKNKQGGSRFFERKA